MVAGSLFAAAACGGSDTAGDTAADADAVTSTSVDDGQDADEVTAGADTDGDTATPDLTTTLPVETASTAPTSTEPTEPTTTETVPVEPIELTVGVPFGVVQIVAAGGLAVDPVVAPLATVTNEPISSPDQLRTGFVAGDLDAAVMPSNVAAVLAARDVDVRIASIVDAQLLQVLGPAGTSWDGLPGAVVDVPFQGDVADLLVQQIAGANGVDVSTVQFRYGTALPELVGAAAGGNVTHAVLPEHFATAASIQAGANEHDLVAIIDLQEAWSDATGGFRLPQIALVVRGELADDHPDVVAALSEGVAAAVAAANADPDSAATMLADATGLPQLLLGGLLPRLQLDTRSAAEARNDLELFFGALFDANPESLGGSMPGDDLYVL